MDFENIDLDNENLGDIEDQQQIDKENPEITENVQDDENEHQETEEEIAREVCLKFLCFFSH